MDLTARHRAQDGVFPTITSLPPSTTGLGQDSSLHLAFSWASHVPEHNPDPFQQIAMHIDDMRPPKRRCAMYDKLYEVRDDTVDADAVSRDSSSSNGLNASDLLQSRMVETSEDRGRVSTLAPSLSLHVDRDKTPEIARLTWSVHVGDTATLAYLRIVRELFSNFLGDDSEFTGDSARHTIIEKKGPPVPSTGPSAVLPDRPTTEALVESFFVHVSHAR